MIGWVTVFCRTFPALAVMALLFSPPSTGAVNSSHKPKTSPVIGAEASFERPDAQALLREAKDLWHVKDDYTGALAKFNAAVAADPNDTDIRLQRGHFFEALSAIVVPEDKERFKERAQADYERIAEADPDSLVAGMARDGLARLAGETFLEVKPVLCPSSAIEIHTRADSLYGARQFSAAAEEYEKATAGCPEAATWWVDLADSHYVLEDYQRAKELFGKALAVDPWNREAHRFLADTELQLRNADAAVHELVLAVVSDPSYESGWMALRMYATALGRKWNRVYGQKKTESKGADGASWVAYRAAKGNAKSGASALAIERAAVRSALKTPAPGPFWSMMSRADRAGYLDEAIFIHMLDSSLAAEYPTYREKNAEKLASYLETVIMQ